MAKGEQQCQFSLAASAEEAVSKLVEMLFPLIDAAKVLVETFEKRFRRLFFRIMALGVPKRWLHLAEHAKKRVSERNTAIKFNGTSSIGNRKSIVRKLNCELWRLLWLIFSLLGNKEHLSLTNVIFVAKR